MLPTDGSPIDIKIAKNIIDYGKDIGESEYVKDSNWVAYEYKGLYYVSLNDDYEYVWEISKEQIKEYGIDT